ncbi:hypothetical protein ABZ990_21330 [Streptomyces sp. NPDC046203]|uniref:BACON domain-containing protein n=1 Tax=Streptomyces sp. NPDC046203 TaxID=3154602 RepID=UPI0033E2A3C8
MTSSSLDHPTRGDAGGTGGDGGTRPPGRHTARNERAERAERHERSGRPGRSGRSGRHDKAEKHEKHEKDERPERFERYDTYLDSLFTYCLSVLCDHDAAATVLGDVLALAERHQGRCPADESGRRAWLYALARWACLRALGEQRRGRRGAHTGRLATPSPALDQAPALGPAPAPALAFEQPTGPTGPTGPTRPTGPTGTTEAARRRAELAALAWPEAAGTTPEQREALELAVRHGLGHREIAAVLSLDAVRTRELLSSAACEVERTRAALAVVETGGCPTVERLTGDPRVLLSATLRTELVRHVDDCPRCRRAAERAGARGPWPGALTSAALTSPEASGDASAAAGRALPVVSAPRAAAYGAARVPRPRSGAPRFAATGFPMDPKDLAARRARARTRVLTTTLVAAVVAAPVLALWTSYRGVPGAGEGADGTRISAREAADGPGIGSDGLPTARYENTGSARATPAPHYTQGSRSPDVSVEVISPGAPATGPVASGATVSARIAATARGSGTTTLLTLTNRGGRPGTWALWSDAPWLYVSRASGSLGPGESVTVHISVDRHRQPGGSWSARVGVQPAGAVVRIDGYGTRPAPETTRPAPPHPTGGPTTPPPTSAPPTGPPPTDEPTRPPATQPPTDPATTEPTPPPTPTGPPPTAEPPDTDPDPGQAAAARRRR